MTATFEQWLQASFDHPPPKTIKDDDWFRGEGFESFWEPLGISDVVTVKYLKCLFSEPEHLKQYSLEQVAEGIWFLIGGSSPARASRALLNQNIDISERVNCIEAIGNFFRNFVTPLASGTAMADTDAFQGACFMW